MELCVIYEHCVLIFVLRLVTSVSQFIVCKLLFCVYVVHLFLYVCLYVSLSVLP